MMMNYRYKLTTAVKSAIGIGALSIALVGCGNDGKDGEDGENGNIGVDIQQATSLQANILHATITEGVVAVDFKLENANGVAVSGLESFDDINTLGFGIAKLDALQKRDMHAVGQPATPEQFKGVKPTQWTSYINTVKSANLEHIPEGYNHLAGDQIQANIETGCKTDCIERLEHGTYRYTFSKALSEYEQIEAVNTEFNPELTHRVTLELKPTSTFSAATLVNTHYDFVPALDRAAEADETRNLVDLQESCIRCHSDDYEHAWAPKLMMHGSKRIEIENCVVCHTTYSGDPETGATIDFGSMLHRIHDGTYLMAGYGGSVHDYTNTTFPTDMGNCQTCHINEDHSPAQAENFHFHRQEACASCHMADFNPVDNAEWLTPPGESKDRGFVGNYFHYYATPEIDGVEGADVRGVFENQSCSSCHADDSNPQGAAIFHMAHTYTRDQIISDIELALTNATLMSEAEGETSTMTFTLNHKGLESVFADSVNSVWLTAAGEVDNGFTSEVANNQSRKVWDLISNANVSAEESAFSTDFTIENITANDFGVTHSGMLMAKAIVCTDKKAQVLTSCEVAAGDENSIELLEVTLVAQGTEFGTTESRRHAASEAKCISCHEGEFDIKAVHNRNSTPSDSGCGACHSPVTATSFTDGNCASCHNSNMTMYLNATSKHTPGDIQPFRQLNNTLDYRNLVHTLHANKRTKSYGDNDVDAITFPNHYGDCSTCHDKGQLDMNEMHSLPATITAREGATERGDAVEFSPIAATCASCHTKNSNSLRGHVESNGGVFGAPLGTYDGTESCATCHAEGKSFGVDKVHPTNYK